MKKASSDDGKFILGRARMAKFAEVEGIMPCAELDADFRMFEEQCLSPEQRRRILLKKYGSQR